MSSHIQAQCMMTSESQARRKANRERSIQVYLDSVQRKEQWQEAAKENDMTLSAWVMHHVQRSMRWGDEPITDLKTVEKLEATMNEAAKALHMAEQTLHEGLSAALSASLREFEEDGVVPDETSSRRRD